MGEGKGWISIYRKIQDSWLWNEKPFDKSHAWIDLLLLANYQDKKILFDANLIEVKRGEFVTSIRKLCDRWGWSNSKVKRFLELLSDDKMITYKSDTKKTAINIINYSDYQDLSDAKSVTETSPITHRNATETPQKHTNNKDNNINNINKDNKNIYCPNSNEFRLASYLFKYIKRNNPKAKEPNFQTWSKQFDYILRLDKRDIEEVKEVIKWCQSDTFWYRNILSPDKLRKQYDRLIVSMKPKKEASNGQNRKSDEAADELEKQGLGFTL